MISSKLRLAVTVVLPLLVLGCDSQTKQRREPLLYKPLDRGSLDGYSQPMVLNAAAHNMVVADGHFYPHTGKLNGLGTNQLDRIGISLERFDGMVRYETRSVDEDLVAARIESIKQYLTDTGLDTTSITIAPMLSGGRPVSAMDAIAAKNKALAVAGDAGKQAKPEGK